MTTLPSKNIRDQVGINTFEKAIIFSASLLMSARQLAGLFDKKNYISLDYENETIDIAFSLNFDSNYWATAGNFYKGIVTMTGVNVEYKGQVYPNTGLELEPSDVNNLEKYFVWSTENLLSLYLKRTTEEKKNINFEIDNVNSAINIFVQLKFNLSQYLKENCLLFDFTDPTVKTQSFNDDCFGNDFVLTND